MRTGPSWTGQVLWAEDPSPRGDVSPQVPERVRRVAVVAVVRMPGSVLPVGQAEAAAHGVQEQDHRRQRGQQHRYTASII